MDKKPQLPLQPEHPPAIKKAITAGRTTSAARTFESPGVPRAIAPKVVTPKAVPQHQQAQAAATANHNASKKERNDILTPEQLRVVKHAAEPQHANNRSATAVKLDSANSSNKKSTGVATNTKQNSGARPSAQSARQPKVDTVANQQAMYAQTPNPTPRATLNHHQAVAQSKPQAALTNPTPPLPQLGRKSMPPVVNATLAPQHQPPPAPQRELNPSPLEWTTEDVVFYLTQSDPTLTCHTDVFLRHVRAALL